MTRLFFLIAILVCSCEDAHKKSQQKFQIRKEYDYFIAVEIWSGFPGSKSSFILDNSRVDRFDSSEKNIYGLKPLTLYHISYRLESDPGRGLLRASREGAGAAERRAFDLRQMHSHAVAAR